VDLARAVAPEARIEFVGARGSEKLAECLLTEEESSICIELDPDHLAVLPHNPSWQRGRLQGKPVPISTYTSDKNDRWLSVDELRKEVRRLEGEDRG
jgi:UDP-N-acetylglucosamine 4,6-dehydratase